MRYSINFNSKNNIKDFGLAIKQRPNIPIPEKNINEITVVGANGNLIEDLGTYKNINIPITFNKISNDIHSDFRQIKGWLMNITDNKLVFTDDPDYYYQVRCIKLDENVERIYKILGRFTAKFVCKPFSFSFDGLNPVTVSNNSVLYNPGTYKAEPTIYIEGTGNIQLFINNRQLNIKNLSGNITINSVLKESYNSDYANLNSSLSGDYPHMDIGKNTISWAGNITKLTIIPNWCWL